MRKTTSLVLLVAFTLISSLPAAANSNFFCNLGRDKERIRHKSGPEVANRVKELKRTNKFVRAALAAFERNEKKSGNRPKVDEATSMSFDREPSRGAVSFLKTKFSAPQVTGDSMEVFTVTTYSAPNEWQGTVFAYKYDGNGNFLDQYVADVILIPDPSYSYWDAILEVSYDNDGAWLEEGTLRHYENMGFPTAIWLAKAPASRKPQFQKVSFTQGWYPFGPMIRIARNPRVRSTVKCMGLACGVVAGGCAAGSAFLAEAPFAPCFVQGCTSSVLGCVAYQIFGN
jgi:hypothetical protein